MKHNTYSQEPLKTALPAVMLIASIFFFNFISRVVLAPLMPVIQSDLGFSHSGAGHLFLALALGTLMVGAGTLLFVAAHWDGLSPASRFALVLAQVALFHLGGAARPSKAFWGDFLRARRSGARESVDRAIYRRVPPMLGRARSEAALRKSPARIPSPPP